MKRNLGLIAVGGLITFLIVALIGISANQAGELDPVAIAEYEKCLEFNTGDTLNLRKTALDQNNQKAVELLKILDYEYILKACEKYKPKNNN